MQRMHGSMMDPAGVRPHGLAQGVQRLASPALAWAPWLHGWAVHGALARGAKQQSAQAFNAATALPMLAFDAQAWQEGLALATAIYQQCHSLQSLWLEGLGEWAEEAAELRHANTVTKLVDQEMNLVQQGVALLASQATAGIRLGENIQANLGYWLARKAQPG